ncbi:fibronectin type III-like domain-contianing protein [Novosphingobium humi]|uniref:Fibronectin type III-like domain-contianing protein n=1 Tax=Novosphingobium humi TaxID=2282397 RepID=A0ABY7U0W0_9SPHN|nr:fibronectin type III-like domain-contianing protein [Novosphingobium humi]WCT79160.1 fibronectin type III-like domain-contianing protein [Novosphingobium humi]
MPEATLVTVDYSEGANVGYRAFARTNEKPLFPFGYGLSYSKFTRSKLAAAKGKKLSLSFSIKNVGERAGADVAQLYLVQRDGERLLRLVGFQKVMLNPGESRSVTFTVDDRLLAQWQDGAWSIPAGSYTFGLGENAAKLDPTITVRLAGRRWKD